MNTGLKKLWRTAKRHIRNQRRRRASRNRQPARTVHSTASYQYDSNGNVTPTTGTAQAAEQAKPTPPDGTLATCRRCHNKVHYNEAHGRWEHTGPGHWECFQPHRI